MKIFRSDRFQQIGCNMPKKPTKPGPGPDPGLLDLPQNPAQPTLRRGTLWRAPWYQPGDPLYFGKYAELPGDERGVRPPGSSKWAEGGDWFSFLPGLPKFDPGKKDPSGSPNSSSDATGSGDTSHGRPDVEFGPPGPPGDDGGGGSAIGDVHDAQGGLKETPGSIEDRLDAAGAASEGGEGSGTPPAPPPPPYTGPKDSLYDPEGNYSDPAEIALLGPAFTRDEPTFADLLLVAETWSPTSDGSGWGSEVDDSVDWSEVPGSIGFDPGFFDPNPEDDGAHDYGPPGEFSGGVPLTRYRSDDSGFGTGEAESSLVDLTQVPTLRGADPHAGPTMISTVGATSNTPRTSSGIR